MHFLTPRPKGILRQSKTVECLTLYSNPVQEEGLVSHSHRVGTSMNRVPIRLQEPGIEESALSQTLLSMEDTLGRRVTQTTEENVFKHEVIHHNRLDNSESDKKFSHLLHLLPHSRSNFLHQPSSEDR